MRKTSGVSLMLLIFLSLCLIIFSLLSLSGAVADETLSSQAADRTTEYYAAVTAANEMLARIDTQLAAYLREVEDSETAESKQRKTEDPETAESKRQETEDQNPEAAESKRRKSAYLQLCSKISEDVSGVSWDDSDADDGAVSFSVSIDGDQILQVQLNVSYPASDDDTLYQIRSWKVVNTDEWKADNSMHLFRSENLSGGRSESDET